MYGVALCDQQKTSTLSLSFKLKCCNRFNELSLNSNDIWIQWASINDVYVFIKRRKCWETHSSLDSDVACHVIQSDFSRHNIWKVVESREIRKFVFENPHVFPWNLFVLFDFEGFARLKLLILKSQITSIDFYVVAYDYRHCYLNRGVAWVERLQLVVMESSLRGSNMKKLLSKLLCGYISRGLEGRWTFETEVNKNSLFTRRRLEVRFN